MTMMHFDGLNISTYSDFISLLHYKKPKPLKIKLTVEDQQPANVDVFKLFDMIMFKN